MRRKHPERSQIHVKDNSSKLCVSSIKLMWKEAQGKVKNIKQQLMNNKMIVKKD